METLKLPRSPEWTKLRAKWLADHPTCAACGGKKSLEVHHKVPVHVSRSMELDANNLITLCESKATVVNGKGAVDHCHLMVGHLGNWFAYNKNVDKQAHDLLLKTYPVLQHDGTLHSRETAIPLAVTPPVASADPAASATIADESSPLNRVKRVQRRR